MNNVLNFVNTYFWKFVSSLILYNIYMYIIYVYTQYILYNIRVYTHIYVYNIFNVLDSTS